LTLQLEHYSRPDVQKEISEFCEGRWIAAHYVDASGTLVFRRYVGKNPMRITQPESLSRLMQLKDCCLRSVYATANVYGTITSVEDVYDLSNIKYCTPTWDIDRNLLDWQGTVAVAKEIVSFLNSRGIDKSLYIKWSGNGCHVHVHHEAFSDDLLKERHPLDLAYAVVEYVNSKLSQKLKELSSTAKTAVENKMDLTRVFTCPLSLHRELGVVCVCMKPDQLSSFSPEWIRPANFNHDTSWREFIKGEADQLALNAYKTVGGYPVSPRPRRRKKTPLDKQIVRWLQRE